MAYLLAFIEGLATFISPCVLPLLPVYISYFAGNTSGTELEEEGKKRVFFNATVKNVLSFTLGLIVVYVLLGGFVGHLGFILKNSLAVRIVSGIIVIIFGIHFSGLITIPVLDKRMGINMKQRKLGFFSSILFGMILAIALGTTCGFAFLAPALSQATMSGQFITGASLMLAYAIGLAIPFLLSAIFIDKLKTTFNFIKRNYKTINLIAGIILILLGISMIVGWFDKFVALLTF